MCMMIYISADQPLDLVPWNETSPAFHVTKLDNSEESVRGQFRHPYVYYVGSHEGCGCGFQYGEYPEYEDEERHLKRASLDAFASYLAQQLEQVKVIDLFACWDGNQSKPPDVNRRLTTETLRSEDFFFREKESSRIEKDAA